MNKRKVKALRQLANLLPKCYIRRPHTEQGTLGRMHELRDEGLKIDLPELTEENADKIVSVTYEATEVLNHHRRLKQAWKRHKTQGLQEYVKWVDDHNKKMASERVDPGLMQIAMSSASSFWKNLMIWLIGFSKFFSKSKNDDEKFN